MASNAQNLLAFTIAPTGSYDVDINLAAEGIKFFVGEVDVTYGATGSPTGVTLNAYTGVGNNDPLCVIGQAPYNFAIPVMPGGSLVPDYGDNPYPVVMTTVPANKGSSQTVRTQFYLNSVPLAYHGWTKFRFANTDPANPVTVTFKATIN